MLALITARRRHERKKVSNVALSYILLLNPTHHHNEGASKNAKEKPSSQPEEVIYSDPYEEDPAYRAPAVPKHKTIATRDSRASVALVELEENAFNDSFDEDEGDDKYDGTNLEPLTEGASNPLEDFDFSGGYPEASSTEPPTTTPPASSPPVSTPTVPAPLIQPAPTPAVSALAVSTPAVPDPAPIATASAAGTNKTASGIMKDVGNLDFGFGPGNLEPQQAGTTGAGVNSKPPDAGNPDNLMNFDFDFGSASGFPATSDDPFSSDMLGAGAGITDNFADFDLGKLDSNFFEQLDIADMPKNDAWGTGAPPPMNPQDLDPFWSGMDSSAPKFE